MNYHHYSLRPENIIIFMTRNKQIEVKLVEYDKYSKEINNYAA